MGEYDLHVPDELAAGVWANAVEVDVGYHEITFDFVRLDFSTGWPPTHGRVVARVAVPPALLESVVGLARQAIDEYSSRLGKEPFDGTPED